LAQLDALQVPASIEEVAPPVPLLVLPPVLELEMLPAVPPVPPVLPELPMGVLPTLVPPVPVANDPGGMRESVLTLLLPLQPVASNVAISALDATAHERARATMICFVITSLPAPSDTRCAALPTRRWPALPQMSHKM
jgi:hypothetical protein